MPRLRRARIRAHPPVAEDRRHQPLALRRYGAAPASAPLLSTVPDRIRLLTSRQRALKTIGSKPISFGPFAEIFCERLIRVRQQPPIGSSDG